MCCELFTVFVRKQQQQIRKASKDRANLIKETKPNQNITMRFTLLLLNAVVIVGTTNAFVVPTWTKSTSYVQQQLTINTIPSIALRNSLKFEQSTVEEHQNGKSNDIVNNNSNNQISESNKEHSNSMTSSSSVVSVLMSLLIMATTTSIDSANAAAGPDWGIFEGRTGSIIHPLVMGSLFIYSIYTAYLGLQWKRQRTIGDEISTLKSTLPTLDTSVYKTYSDALADATTQGLSTVSSLTAAIDIEQQIKSLQAERKSLAEKGPRDQHFAQGAVLAFLGTAFAIEGPLNTYARAGKLFPGPHLYVGAGLVVVWSLAVATIPSMQKGSDLARTIHISANIAGIGLFGWQVTTGLPILFKVWELTKWP